jgi:nucleotide-binding universal stress UspA family protein
MTRTSLSQQAGSFTPAVRRPTGPVLLATDGASATDAIFTAARLLAERAGTTVEVVAVLDPIPVYAPDFGIQPLPPELDSERREAMREEVRRRVGEAAGADWRVDVLVGEPARTIADVARKLGARLIVMGLGRHGALARFLGRETTLQTIRLADRPVFAVADWLCTLPRRAIVGTDFSPSSARAAQAALDVLRPGGVLTIVHVRPRVDVHSPALREWDEAHGRATSELFARLRRELDAPAEVRVDVVTLIGEASEELLRYSERAGADLVTVGSHGRGLVERLLLGSVSTGVLRGAHCSVLATPEPSAAESLALRERLSGVTEVVPKAEWSTALDAFTRRNAGRQTALEVDAPSIGTQSQERGYRLVGATYDPRDARVELMLGDPSDRTGHLTRSVGGVSSIELLHLAEGGDAALRIAHGRAQTILSFPLE